MCQSLRTVPMAHEVTFHRTHETSCPKYDHVLRCRCRGGRKGLRQSSQTILASDTMPDGTFHSRLSKARGVQNSPSLSSGRSECSRTRPPLIVSELHCHP